MESYLFFGSPGSGKGTQRTLLEQHLTEHKAPWLAIDTGQLLREQTRKPDTPIEKRLAGVMSSGGLVPSAFPITIWARSLLAIKESFDHVVIDGAGRKLIEARVLVELLLFLEDMHIHVFYLDISEKEAVQRLLKRGRGDDHEAVIKNRFVFYRDTSEGTCASIDYLRAHEQVNFYDIDGVGTIEEVHDRILSHVIV